MLLSNEPVLELVFRRLNIIPLYRSSIGDHTFDDVIQAALFCGASENRRQ